jgi:hypothetical protein
MEFSKYDLEDFAKLAAKAYLDDGQDLNETITKLARENVLNSNHVDRVVQNANILVNGSLVKQALDGGRDPRIKFDKANSHAVARILSGDTVKEASAVRREKLASMFSVEPEKSRSVIDEVVGLQAPDPYSGHAKSVDHVELAELYIKEPEKVASISGKLTSATIGLAHQTLETLESEARRRHDLDKMAMDEAEISIRNEIHDQILNGSNPATIRDVVKTAEMDLRMKKTMDSMISKVASDLRSKEGASTFVDGSGVNANHPLIKKAFAVGDLFNRAVSSKNGFDKFASAKSSAESDLKSAMREGR